MVFTQKKLRSKSTSVFLIGLAIVDTVLLNVGLLPWWVEQMTGVNIRLLSQAACKLHVLFTYAPIQCSAWILVVVTIERVISVFLPLKSRVIITRRRACISLVLVLLVVIGLNLSLVWCYNLQVQPNGILKCKPGPEKIKSEFNFKYYVWIDSFVASYIPSFVMSICNIAIIIKLVKSRLRRRSTMNVKIDDSSNLSSMTAMLLTLNFTFLMTTSPIVIFLAHIDYFYGDNSPHAVSKANLAYTVVTQLSYLNSALNFFLYCLSGSTFRENLRLLFCSCRTQTKYGSSSRTDLSTISRSISEQTV